MRILIAEDEDITRKHLLRALEDEGFEAVGARDGLEAWQEMSKSRFDLLLADLKMPNMDGMALLEKVKEVFPDTDVVIITGFGSIDSAVEAMKKGAADYVTKPFNLDEVVLKAKRILEKKSLENENAALKIALGLGSDIPFIAKSASMRSIMETVGSISASGCNVFLSGESGVGKGLVARLIHYSGPRRDRAFLSINCAVFTEELLASELFGHEKGAFTGAVRDKRGLFEIADRGTLFLDEIGEMALPLQAKLLKAVEEREFMRVGGTVTRKADIRLIAATNVNIKNMLSEGRFREDLYYRLNVMDIHIPPLRERREDILPLCRFFLDKHSKKVGRKFRGFAAETVEFLKSYSYPGNVRELENIIERAVILEKSPNITIEHLPQSIRMFQVETLHPDRVKTIEEISSEYARAVLEHVSFNRTKAAELLGISRTNLWRILKK